MQQRNPPPSLLSAIFPFPRMLWLLFAGFPFVTSGSGNGRYITGTPRFRSPFTIHEHREYPNRKTSAQGISQNFDEFWIKFDSLCENCRNSCACHFPSTDGFNGQQNVVEIHQLRENSKESKLHGNSCFKTSFPQPRGFQVEAGGGRESWPIMYEPNLQSRLLPHISRGAQSSGFKYLNSRCCQVAGFRAATILKRIFNGCFQSLLWIKFRGKLELNIISQNFVALMAFLNREMRHANIGGATQLMH